MEYIFEVRNCIMRENTINYNILEDDKRIAKRKMELVLRVSERFRGNYSCRILGVSDYCG